MVFSTTKNSRPSFGGCVRFIESFLRTNSSIVHLHASLLWSNALSLFLKQKSCPWVGHIHTYPVQSMRLKHQLLDHITCYLCDAYIAVSKSVAAATREQLNSKGILSTPPVYVVYNGVELEKIQSDIRMRDGTIWYGMATRLAEDKGVWEFLHVAEEIARRQPQARFILAGKGPLGEQVRNYVDEKNLSELVSLPGHIDDIASFWRDVDVAIFTAPQEPFGLRLIEPMAYGVPVAAYRTGYGSDELLIEAVTGLSSRWGDVIGLAENAMRLATDQRFRSKISQSAEDYVRNTFAIDSMCRAVNAIYDELLAVSK